MTTSIFLARLLGPMLVLAGTGLALNRDFYRGVASDFLANRGLLYFAGVAVLLGGTAIVLTHNIWSTDWRLIITLLGWLLVLRGVALVVAPRWSIEMAQRLMQHPQTLIINAVVVIVLGVVLCALGYPD